jgi:hypothetical protein
MTQKRKALTIFRTARIFFYPLFYPFYSNLVLGMVRALRLSALKLGLAAMHVQRIMTFDPGGVILHGQSIGHSALELALSSHSAWPKLTILDTRNGNMGASHGILPHVANIDNRSATVLICKCSLLCNNIAIATHTGNSTAPSLLWYGLVTSAQQRTAFSNDPTGVLYWVRLKTWREIRGRDFDFS